MRVSVRLVVLSLLVAVPILAQSSTSPRQLYQNDDWLTGTDQDKAFMGVCEVLEDVLARYEIFREHENNPIDLEGWQDLEQKFHFAVMIGQWKQHLRQDLNTYLTQDPPGQHTESARLLLSLLDSGTILYFEISFDGGTLSPDDSSWEFYREWLKMEAEVLGARPYCQANEIRMTTLIRWAQEDGFITQTEAEEYLSLVQPAQP